MTITTNTGGLLRTLSDLFLQVSRGMFLHYRLVLLRLQARGFVGSNPTAPTKFYQLDGLFETLIGDSVTTAGNHRCMLPDGRAADQAPGVAGARGAGEGGDGGGGDVGAGDVAERDVCAELDTAGAGLVGEAAGAQDGPGQGAGHECLLGGMLGGVVVLPPAGVVALGAAALRAVGGDENDAAPAEGLRGPEDPDGASRSTASRVATGALKPTPAAKNTAWLPWTAAASCSWVAVCRSSRTGRIPARSRAAAERSLRASPLTW